MVKLTPEIEVPPVAGQNQHGSARFTTIKEQNKYFKSVKISPEEELIKALINEGKEDIEAIKNNVVRNAEPLNLESKVKIKSGVPIAHNVLADKVEEIKIISDDVHTICFGATRCGKTRTIVLQSICIQALGGMDILNSDPKGELYQYTYPYLKRLNYKVYALDFKNPERSIHFNYLQFIINALNDSNISKATQCCWDFVDCLVQEPTKGEPLWTNGEKSLMAAGVMQVVFDNSPLGLIRQYPNCEKEEINRLYETKHKYYQNCTNLFNYISQMSKVNPKTEKLLLEDIIDVLDDNHPSKMIMRIAESAPSKMRGSFITSALTTLRLFTDPNIAEMTNYTDEGFLDLSKKKAIFLIVPDTKKTYYSLVSLFVTQYYEYVCNYADEHGGRLDRNLECNFDEFGNFSRIPDFEVKMTVAGGRGIHFNMYTQSKEQLTEKYGKEISSIILDNCHYWIYLKSGIDTAKIIEEKLGKYTVKSISASASLNDKGGLTMSTSGSTSTSTQLMGRSLLMADEIVKINRPYLLVLADNGFPSLLNSPDLHKWLFNQMLGLGDVEFNKTVRELRENNRDKHPISPLKLWDFKPYINNLIQEKIEMQQQNKEEQQEILDAIAQNFSDD